MSATERTAHGHSPEQEDELTTVVRNLSDRIEALQADVRRLGGPALPAVEPGWDGDVAASTEPSYAWVSSVGAPVRRRRAVPRLFLEVVFLAGVAAAATVAKLDAPTIAGLMAGSWVLVALIEWAGSRADRRRDAVPPIEPIAPAEPLPADPSWFVAPVEHTLIEPAADSPTVVTRLPPQDIEGTVERPSDV